MGTEQIKKVLIAFGDVMHRHDFIPWFFNWVGWWIISLFKYLVDGAEYLLSQIYSINDFIFSDQVQSYIKAYQPILWILFAFALIVLGWTLIVDQDKRPRVFQNFILSILVLTALPVVIVQISSFTLSAANFAQTGSSISGSFAPGTDDRTADMKVSDSIIITNTTDLLWCHDKGWENLRDLNTGENTGNISAPWNNLQTLDGFDINEKIWIHDSSRYYHNYDEFKYYLSQDVNGATQLESIDDQWWGFLINDYYRYHVDWFPTILTLLFTALALLFAAYKVARLIWELAVHQLLAMLFAAGDLTSGQKLKEILKSMGSIFLTIYLVSVMLKFFLLGVSYLQTTQMNGFVKAMIIVFFALAAIDGPNIVERILGIDAGIKSGFHTAFAFARGAGAVKRSVSNVSRKVGGAAAAAAGKSGSISERYRQWSTRNNKAENSIHSDKSKNEGSSGSSQAKESNGVSREDTNQSNHVSGKAADQPSENRQSAVNTAHANATNEKNEGKASDSVQNTSNDVKNKSNGIKNGQTQQAANKYGGIHDNGFKSSGRKHTTPGNRGNQSIHNTASARTTTPTHRSSGTVNQRASKISQAPNAGGENTVPKNKKVKQQSTERETNLKKEAEHKNNDIRGE